MPVVPLKPKPLADFLSSLYNFTALWVTVWLAEKLLFSGLSSIVGFTEILTFCKPLAAATNGVKLTIWLAPAAKLAMFMVSALLLAPLSVRVTGILLATKVPSFFIRACMFLLIVGLCGTASSTYNLATFTSFVNVAKYKKVVPLIADIAFSIKNILPLVPAGSSKLPRSYFNNELAFV